MDTYLAEATFFYTSLKDLGETFRPWKIHDLKLQIAVF